MSDSSDKQNRAATSSLPHIIAGVQVGPVSAQPLDWPADCGGECVFLGRTRGERHAEFGALQRLEYEMYEPMAVKLLEAMARDAAARWDCKVIRLMHSRGPVALGEASVVIQVATPHRGESFEACRYLIDRLKRELPVWKHEIWERGRTFVEGSSVQTAQAD
ncbi:MAG: molybdenum cofactor biosynthesis protein MoaE [Phycisphaeraceae bacterium]